MAVCFYLLRLTALKSVLHMISLTCGCHIRVHAHHKVELKNLEGHAVLGSRSQTLDIPLCLG